MIKKLSRSLWAKVETEPWLSGLGKILFVLFLLSFPTQLGKHFWPTFSYVNGIRIDYLSPTFYFSDVLIIALIILNMKNFRIGSRKIKVSKNIKYLISIFVLFFVASLLFSSNFFLETYYLLKIIEIILLAIILLLKKDYFFDFIQKTLPFSIIFESILSILQFLNRGSINGFFYFFGERSFNSQTPQIANASINGELILRPYGTFPHPNVLAAFLVISMSLVLTSILNFRKQLNLFVILSFILGTTSLLLTFSRTAIIVYVFSLVVIILKQYLGRNSIKLYLSGLFVLITAILLSLVRFRFSFNLSDNSIVDRKDLALAALKMIQSNPIFGVGLNNFLPKLPNYFSGRQNIYYIQPVHNAILLSASEIGIIPTLIIIYFCLILYKKTNFWGKLILFQMFLLSLFDHYFLTLQQGQILLGIIFASAIILAINGKIKEDA